jgi:hypothetical protein
MCGASINADRMDKRMKNDEISDQIIERVIAYFDEFYVASKEIIDEALKLRADMDNQLDWLYERMERMEDILERLDNRINKPE